MSKHHTAPATNDAPATPLPEAPTFTSNKKSVAIKIGAVALLLGAVGWTVKSCHATDGNTAQPTAEADGTDARTAAGKAADKTDDTPAKGDSTAAAATAHAPPLLHRDVIETGATLVPLRHQLDELQQALAKLETTLTGKAADIDDHLNRLQLQQDSQQAQLQQLAQTLEALRQQTAGKTRRRVRRAARPPRVKVISIDRWGDHWQAVVENNGLHILREGSKFQGWTVKKIDPAGLTLVLNQRKVVIQ